MMGIENRPVFSRADLVTQLVNLPLYDEYRDNQVSMDQPLAEILESPGQPAMNRPRTLRLYSCDRLQWSVRIKLNTN